MGATIRVTEDLLRVAVTGAPSDFVAQLESEEKNEQAPVQPVLHIVDGYCWVLGPSVRPRPHVNGTTVYWPVSFDENAGIGACRIEPQDNRTCLEKHRFLEDLIEEAFEQLKAAFPGECLTLTEVVDPDEPDSAMLVLKLKTSMNYEEAIHLWEQFESDWWLPNYDRGRDKLSILLDF